MKNIHLNYWKHFIQAWHALMLLSLAACASSSSGFNRIEQHVRATDDVAVEKVTEDLPLQELDQEVFEHVLTLNLASYQGDWTLAAKSAAIAALKSRDYRLAQLGTSLAVKAGDNIAAYEMSQLWHELQTDNADARNAALITQVAAGEVAQAQINVDELLRENLGDGIKLVAGLLLKQSNVDAAMQVMQSVVEKNEGSLAVLLSAVYVANVFAQREKETQWLSEALLIDPNSETAIKLKINQLERQGKLEERQHLISEFLQAHPRSIQIRLSQVSDFSRQGDHAQAFKLVEQVLEDDPNNLETLAYAGVLAEYLQESKKAKSLYHKILQLNPKDDRTRFSLGQLEVSQKNYQKAEKLFAKIQDESLWFNAQLHVAEMRYELNGIHAALKYFNRLTPQTHKNYVDFVIARHYLLFDAARYEDALDYINEAILVMQNEQKFVYARALVAAELRQLGLAESDFRSILAEQPDHANALNALGYTLADQTQRYEEAKGLIQKALVLRPNDAHILDSMGWVLYRMREMTEAIDYMRRAYAANKDSEVAAHLGEVLWESGQQEDAKIIWTDALAEDSKHPALNETIQRYGFKP